MKPTQSPPPGSAIAISQGCTCPVMDNHAGRGPFAVSDDCPLHGKRGADMPEALHDSNEFRSEHRESVEVDGLD